MPLGCWRSLVCLSFRRSSVLADLFPSLLADRECPSFCCTALAPVPVSTTDRALRLLHPMLPPIRRVPQLQASPYIQAAPNCVPRTNVRRIVCRIFSLSGPVLCEIVTKLLKLDEPLADVDTVQPAPVRLVVPSRGHG